MEILVFLFVISNANLVLTDNSNAIEANFPQQNTYKVHSDPEDAPRENDQVSESSRTISQVFGPFNSNQIQAQNYIQIPAGQTQDGQHIHQVPQQYAQQQDYQPQHTYVQHYLQPIRILGTETSPLQQARGNENQQSIGFSSYIEHVSQKEEEEINSALREGSVTDIKRLVPKSGISYKIYHNEKVLNMESQKPKIQQNIMTHIQTKIPDGFSRHSKVKPGPPIAPLRIQTPYQQPTPVLEDLHPTYVNTQPGFENPHLLQDQQGINRKQVYYPQREMQPQKVFGEVNEKSSTPTKPQFKINVEDNYGKVVSSAEINSLSAGQNSKLDLADLGHLQYQKQWSYDRRSEGSPKLQSVKPEQVQYDPVVAAGRIREVSTLQYDPLASTERSRGVATLQYELLSSTERPKEVSALQYDPVSSTERTRELSYSQIPAKTNINRQRTQINAKNGINEQSNAYISKGTQTHIDGRTTNRAFADQKLVPNRFSGYYAESTAQSKTINHLGTSAYGDTQTHKTNQSNHYIYSYPNLEPVKSGHRPITTQSNFDHQKALEGSTTFDIKNAIDNSGNSVHHTNYASSFPEIHPLVEIQRQNLSYIIPKIPHSAILTDNGIHNSPVVESHQIKHFGHGISLPQHSYHTFLEEKGKFFHQPQAIIWSLEQLKHALPAEDFNQHDLRLLLPKEEYQYVKTPNVELPTSSASHIVHQQEHPYLLHYDIPVVKYPQEIPNKSKFQSGQIKHIKLSQPIRLEWSWPKNSILSLEPEPTSHAQDSGKKIVPILIRKRKNRSNSKQVVGVVYGKVNNNRRPAKPNQRQEKTVLISLLPQASNNVRQYEAKEGKKNEFSVSASYKVDRSFRSS